MPITPTREAVVWDDTVDVVVVGSGFAGLAAAIEAHDAGASVMMGQTPQRSQTRHRIQALRTRRPWSRSSPVGLT